MRSASLRLSAKALLLVSLLLLVEFLFVGSYFFLLTKAEEEAARQEKAKLIIAKTNDLITVLFEGGFSIQQNVFNKSQADLAKFRRAKSEVPADIAWLREQVRTDPEQLKLLDRIDESTSKALKMLDNMKTISDTEAQMVAVNYALKLRTKLQKQMEALVHDLIEFMNFEKRIQHDSPAVMKQQRDYLRWLLFGALLMNIFAAVMLALLFVRSITSRLSVVVENSQLLRQRAPLKSPVRGDDEIAQLDRAFHEMSSSLRGEEALVKASELQLHAMIDQMPIGLMIIADEGNIEYANPTMERLFSYADEEFVGKRLSDLFIRPGAIPIPFDGVRIESRKASGAASGTESGTTDGAIELIGRKKDGSDIFVEYSVVNVFLGSMARRLAIVIDVTERHELENLRKAFVAMVSHDLRTPLTSVAGFLQMLPMGVYGQLADSAVAEVTAAEAQVDQLIMLINDLLDLEKLEAGKLEMRKASVFLEDVIDAALDTVFGLAEIREVELMFEGCEVDVLADSDRIKQAFSKVLTCLLRLSTKGDSLDIHVKSEKQTNSVNVEFQLHALELSGDKLVTMFEPFQRLELPSLNGSLGLGLTLARAIAQEHGGTCGASAGTPSGTTLWVRLPA